MSFKLEVWGDYALFTRPEMKVERVSYDVITPSAARGIFEAIYWHPGLVWVIDKIYVLNPIKFTNIKRNEVSEKISARSVRTQMNLKKDNPDKLYICTKNSIQQRTSMVLKSVHYIIEAHFVMTDRANPSDNEGKFCDTFRRRAEKGQCFHTPYFGTREFPVNFKLYEGGKIKTAYPNETKDLGFMLYDMDYSDVRDIKPMVFRAVMQNGIIDLTKAEVFK